MQIGVLKTIEFMNLSWDILYFLENFDIISSISTVSSSQGS